MAFSVRSTLTLFKMKLAACKKWLYRSDVHATKHTGNIFAFCSALIQHTQKELFLAPSEVELDDLEGLFQTEQLYARRESSFHWRKEQKNSVSHCRVHWLMKRTGCRRNLQSLGVLLMGSNVFWLFKEQLVWMLWLQLQAKILLLWGDERWFSTSHSTTQKDFCVVIHKEHAVCSVVTFKTAPANMSA